MDTRLLGQLLAALAGAGAQAEGCAGQSAATARTRIAPGGPAGARQPSQRSADSRRKRLTARARSKTSQRSSSPLSTRASDTGCRATMLSRRSEPSVASAKESMAETSRGSSIPPTPARSMARRRRSGPLGQGRQGPGEGQREVELVGRLLVLGQQDHGVLEGEEDAGVDVEGEVQVERATAPLLGVQVDLPDLA